MLAQRLLGLCLKEGDKVCCKIISGVLKVIRTRSVLTVPVLSLLEATEGHLGARNVLLGVLEVLEESVLVPVDSAVLVGIGVGEAGNLARLAAEETVELRANLVALAGLQGVALCATGLEETSALLGVTWRCNVSLWSQW